MSGLFDHPYACWVELPRHILAAHEGEIIKRLRNTPIPYRQVYGIVGKMLSESLGVIIKVEHTDDACRFFALAKSEQEAVMLKISWS